MLTIVVIGDVPALAASGNKTVNSTASMSVILNEGETGYSSYVTFNVSGCPSGSTVSKIEVNVGTLSYQGAVLTYHLELSSSNKSTVETISWGGAGGTKLTSTSFFATTPANGTYKIRFYATCVGGALVGGTMLDIGTKTYSKPSIKIYYTY
jgi:hypothetical protein